MSMQRIILTVSDMHTTLQPWQQNRLYKTLEQCLLISMYSSLEHCRENYPYVLAPLILTRQRFYSSLLELYV
jgi:hypothetical protein